MENSYYTPEISEFGIGFQYEYKTWKGWVKKTMDSLDHRPNGSMSLQYDLHLNKEKFRVKMLGREDIESLGFKKNLGERYQKESRKEFPYNTIEVAPFYTYRQDIREDLVRIFFLSVHDNRTMARSEMFRGNIKNKSELKRILKMIEV